MAKLIRVYDPNETERKINLNIPEDVCPGLLEFMSELPYGKDTPLIRGVFYQWFLSNNAAGTLDQALNAALAGPGGMIPTGRQSRRESAEPPARKKRVPKQREVTARPGTVKASEILGHPEPQAPAAPAIPPHVAEDVHSPRQPEPVAAPVGDSLHSGADEVQAERVQTQPITPLFNPIHSTDVQEANIDLQAQQLPTADTPDEVHSLPAAQDATPTEPTLVQMAALDAMGDMF